jgi:hypothetical protein
MACSPCGTQDLLALAIALLVSYVGILNLPLKRSEAKGKVRRTATSLVALGLLWSFVWYRPGLSECRFG